MDKQMPQYNTLRPPIKIREYGRNLHKLIEQCKQIEDRKKRTKRAYEIVTFMAQLNPEIKDTPEQRQKLWDHLFIMANFELDVDAPYPMPDPEKLKQKPEKMPYPQEKIKFRYYGKNIVKMVQQAIQMEDDEKKKQFVEQIAGYMKLAYLQYNDEKVSDEVIISHLKQISENKLEPPEQVKMLVKPSELKQKASQQQQNKQRQKPSKKKLKNRKK